MSRERKIIRKERKVIVLLEEEIDAIKKEFESLKSKIFSVESAIKLHDDKYFASGVKNRGTILTGIFSAINNAMKECDKEKKLGHLKNFKIIAEELNHLKDSLIHFGHILENPRPINNQKEALFLFNKIIKKSFKRVVEELQKSINFRAGVLYRLKAA